MFECVITCSLCGAEKDVSNLAEQPAFTDQEVIANAGHSPQCETSQIATVQRATRDGEPNLILYTVGV